MSSQNEGAKLPYEKPAIKTIALAAEEVLGIGCKIGAFPAGVPDTQICAVTACDQEGS
jgi:hypothetical protein